MSEVVDTAHVRRSYMAWHEDGDPRWSGEEFDRWLIERDRRISESAWDAAISAANQFRLGADSWVMRNPYRPTTNNGFIKEEN